VDWKRAIGCATPAFSSEGDLFMAVRDIAIIGATGRQGGGLARAILADDTGAFAVRAVTRHPGSERARHLAKLGAEVVEADLDDEPSLRAAFAGAYGAYVVTDFFADIAGLPSSPAEQGQIRAERELSQAVNAAIAAHETGLRHVIWSTEVDTRAHFDRSGSQVPRTEGGYATPHLDAKAEANALFTGLGVPVTFLQPTFYYESLLSGMLAQNADGEPELLLPIADSRLALIAAEDIGRIALAIFRHPEYIGRTVSVAGAHASGEEIAEMISEAVGEKAHYRPLTWEQFRSLPFWSVVTAANAFQYFTEAERDVLARHDLAGSRQLNPAMQPLDTWLRAHSAELLPGPHPT
jgi:uncharacterized protein YbjT (DUF2867 family)